MARWRTRSARRWIRYSDEEFTTETIKVRVPIWMVLALYTDEVPVSGRRSMRCPFHDDRVASATIDNTQGWFRCHTCDVRGDIFSLVQKVEGFSEFIQAREFIVRKLL